MLGNMTVTAEVGTQQLADLVKQVQAGDEVLDPMKLANVYGYTSDRGATASVMAFASEKLRA